jgi:hypothetical protein
MYKGIFYPVFALVVFVFIAIGCLSLNSDIPDKRESNCTSKNELTRIPGWKYSYQIESDCNIPNPGDVSLALQVFYINWYQRFGDPADAVLNNLNNIVVEWRAKKIYFERGYRVDGTFIENGQAIGLTIDKSHIIVMMSRYQKIYDTSLAHELVHASIRATTGQRGDPDHEGDKYSGWTKQHTSLIKEINEILRLMDLNYAEENKKGYEF